MKNTEKRAITDLNATNGSRDIPFQSQEYKARWTSPFCRFSASFSLKYDVTDAILQDNEKMKVQYFGSRLFDLFEILQAVRNFASFQISLPWQPKSKLLSIIEKQKIYCLIKSDVQNVI